MENELRVAGKGKWAIDVVDPALIPARLNVKFNLGKRGNHPRRWLHLVSLEEALSTTKQETHQTVIFFIVNARFFGCVANPLQECGLASVGPTDHENAEMTVFISSFEGG